MSSGFYKGDDLDKKGLDRKLVGEYESYEIDRLVKTYRATRTQVIEALRTYGRSMEAVERYLEETYGKR